MNKIKLLEPYLGKYKVKITLGKEDPKRTLYRVPTTSQRPA